MPEETFLEVGEKQRKELEEKGVIGGGTPPAPDYELTDGEKIEQKTFEAEEAKGDVSNE